MGGVISTECFGVNQIIWSREHQLHQNNQQGWEGTITCKSSSKKMLSCMFHLDSYLKRNNHITLLPAYKVLSYTTNHMNSCYYPHILLSRM